MDHRGKRAIAIAGGVLALGVACFCVYMIIPDKVTAVRGDAYDVKTFKQASCTVRVTAYDEKTTGFVLPGSYLHFEASASTRGDWVSLFEVRFEDRIRIPEGCVKFFNANRIVAFLGSFCASSPDGGSTWHVWDAQKDFSDPDQSRFGGDPVIVDVTMGADGGGIMSIGGGGKRSNLITRDGGVTWRR